MKRLMLYLACNACWKPKDDLCQVKAVRKISFSEEDIVLMTDHIQRRGRTHSLQVKGWKSIKWRGVGMWLRRKC